SSRDKNGTSTIALTADSIGMFFIATTTPNIYTLSLHDALPIFASPSAHTPEPVTLANVHVGASDQMAISITNTATNDGFSEKLRSGVHTTELKSSRTVACSLLPAGSEDNTHLIVGLDTSSAGAK